MDVTSINLGFFTKQPRAAFAHYPNPCCTTYNTKPLHTAVGCVLSVCLSTTPQSCTLYKTKAPHIAIYGLCVRAAREDGGRDSGLKNKLDFFEAERCGP